MGALGYQPSTAQGLCVIKSIPKRPLETYGFQ